MRPVTTKRDDKAGFTIIELLTVMSVIIILIGLLVPALNMVKRFAKRVSQKNQFHAIEVGLETFNAEWDGYPPSDPTNAGGGSPLYCGAMKLAEALVGQDLQGFHPDARFVWPDGLYQASDVDRSARRKYVKPQSANVNRLDKIFPERVGSSLMGDMLVVCDVYTQNWTNPQTGESIGMPVLYYRADPTKRGHSQAEADSGQSIYDYRDNDALVQLGMPFEQPPPSGPAHLMDSRGLPTMHRPPLDRSSAQVFYDKTWNDSAGEPYNSDTYILLSAGFDGEYGTDDDVFNFIRK